MKNKYIYHSKISESKFRVLLKLYCLDETAYKTYVFVGFHASTIERVFNLLRIRLANLALKETDNNTLGEFKVNESYFGAKRVRGKRGRGAAGKKPVFGLLKRNGKVDT